MDGIVEMIVGSSSTLDVYVVVRLCVFALALEFTTVICGILAGLKGR